MNIYYAIRLNATLNTFVGHEGEETTLHEAELHEATFAINRGEWRAISYNPQTETLSDTGDDLSLLVHPPASEEGEAEDWDGQPDEMQEWHDFDPDC